MPPEANPTPTPETTPIQNVEAPEAVDNLFKQAAQTLAQAQEATETPPEAPAEPKAEEPTEEPAPKPEKKAKAAPEPEPEPEPEPPKKTKRELFKERAQAEKSRRDNESKIKEREAALEQRMAKLEELENTYKQFQADPISWLERNNPRAYEEWTARNLKDPKDRQPQEDPRIAALEKKIEEIKGNVETKTEEAGKQVSRAEYIQYMGEAKSVLQDEEFKPVHESAAIISDVLGEEVNIERAIASVYDEYYQQYGTHLTPRDACEILLEDAQAHLERVPKSERLRSLFGQVEQPAEKPKKKKKAPPTSGNHDEAQTASAPDQPPDIGRVRSREQMIQEAARVLEYEAEE